MLSQLDLTEAQKADVQRVMEANKPSEADRASMKQGFEAHEAEMRARLEGFTAEQFDAAAFLEKPKVAKGPEAHLEKMVRTFNAVLPILTQQQREELAARLEQGPPAPPEANEE